MTRYTGRHWTLAACLSALAGYVDAIGFLKLGGLFVSFMSGNSTRLAVGLGQASPVALVAGSLVACFLGGVIVGSLLAQVAGSARKPAVLVLAGTLLAVSAVLEGGVAGWWSALTMAAGMGAANCVFQRDGEVSIGVTYMTGALVKLGQHIAAALVGRDRFGWVPYLVLWSGLVAGAFAGALLYPRIGPSSLWIGCGATALLAVAAHRLGPAQPIGGRAGSAPLRS